MSKNKLVLSLAAGGMGLVGLIAGVATMAGAQGVINKTATTTPAQNVSATVTGSSVDTPEPGDTPDVAGTATAEQHGHAPLGGDGVVSSITGTTIVMSEESNENGSSYTIDASKATFTNNGVAGSISDIKVGEKIFVQGTTTGTNVVATSISVGSHKGQHMEKGNDSDGGAASEASEPAGSSDAGGDQ